MKKPLIRLPRRTEQNNNALPDRWGAEFSTEIDGVRIEYEESLPILHMETELQTARGPKLCPSRKHRISHN